MVEALVPLLEEDKPLQSERCAAMRIFIIKAWGATGDRDLAMPKLITVLDEPEVGFLHGEVLLAIRRKGPAARSAKSSVLAWFGRAEYGHAAGLEALSAMGEKLERPQLASLMAGYKTRCAEAGSIFMLNLGRDADCARQKVALEVIYERSGSWFRGEFGEPR